MTRSEVRKAMQIAIPAVLAFSHYFLSAGAETACIMVGCWVYNDLKVSDDSLILRNAIASLAFGVFNWSSLKVAIGGHAEYLPKVAEAGSAWIWIYSGVIFTTLHVQDLKDQAGDRVRGRSTAPLVIGDGLTRWTLAVPITLWAPVCAMHCEASLYYAVLVSVFGAYVAWRCLRHREQAQDRWTWQ
jgi:4-hydroxybenzoate polyprenyltransferase